MNRRPLSVAILSWLLIAAGVVGFVYHSTEFKPLHPFRFDVFGVELIRVLAVISGAFMLRARNWARWLAIAWIGFHVGVSFFHSRGEFAMHALILVIFAFILFRPNANVFFRTPETASR